MATVNDYTRTTWQTGDVIDATKMNNIETQLDAVTDNARDNGTAPVFSTTKTYAVGEHVLYNGEVYKCKTAVTNAGAWVASNWVKAYLSSDMEGEVSELKSASNNLSELINLSAIETGTESYIDWEVGGLSNSGEDVVANSRRRTKNYIPAKKWIPFTITVPKGHIALVCFYNTSKVFSAVITIDATSAVETKTTTTQTDSLFRMMLTATTGYDMDTASVVVTTPNGVLQNEIAKTDSMLEVGNRFNIDSCIYNVRLNNSTGAEDNMDTFISSDYIDVENVASIALSSSAYSLVFYDSSKNILSVLASVSPGARFIAGYNAKYIRLSMQNEAAKTFVLTFNSEVSGSAEYGYVPTDRISGVDISKQFSTLTNQNTGEKNILDESTYTMQHGIAYDDYHYTKGNSKSIKMHGGHGATILDCRITPATAISVNGICSFVVEFFASSNISNVTLELIGTSYTRTKTVSAGWNRVIFNTFEGSVATWVSCTKIRVYFTCSGDCTAWLSSITAVRNAKAKIIVIDDHSYSSFLSIAYPRLKSLGIPVTWALDPGKIGQTVSEDVGTILTQEEIDSLAYDYNSEFSIHAWDSAIPTENMTPTEIMNDTFKCIAYLRNHGIEPTHLWRAAWTQNRAINASAAYCLLEGCATSTDEVGLTAYPIQNKYSIPRFTIHGRTLAQLQTTFDIMSKTHCLLVAYTHGVTDAGGIHSTNSEIDNFISCLTTAVSDGWLEGTTFSRLMTYPN